ncbi:hypothetical protein [Aquimarina litoralis]
MKHLIPIFFLLFIFQGYAQLPDQIELPKHRGKKITYEHEFAKAFLYVSSDNRMYDLLGEQIKNPNVITEKLKKIPKESIHEVYIFADKRADYKTIDKIKAAVARSGIDQVVHMMRFISGFRSAFGYTNKLDIPKKVLDTKKTAIPTTKEKYKKLSYQQIRIQGNKKVRLLNGKELEIDSKAYKKMINSSDLIAVDYASNLLYEDYIFWLNKTQKVLKKQKKEKPTRITEQLVTLMKYSNQKEVKITRNPEE